MIAFGIIYNPNSSPARRLKGLRGIQPPLPVDSASHVHCDMRTTRPEDFFLHKNMDYY